MMKNSWKKTLKNNPSYFNDPEQFKTYQVPDEFMRVYKTLSTATEMMKNTWKRVLKNNQSYLSDPEKQKVLRFAMQRPANYLTEIETYL